MMKKKINYKEKTERIKFFLELQSVICLKNKEHYLRGYHDGLEFCRAVLEEDDDPKYLDSAEFNTFQKFIGKIIGIL